MFKDMPNKIKSSFFLLISGILILIAMAIENHVDAGVPDMATSPAVDDRGYQEINKALTGVQQNTTQIIAIVKTSRGFTLYAKSTLDTRASCVDFTLEQARNHTLLKRIFHIEGPPHATFDSPPASSTYNRNQTPANYRKFWRGSSPDWKSF